MYKPWNKTDTLYKILKDKERTIKEFLRMIDAKEVPTSILAQYTTAMKYSGKPRAEVLVKVGVNHPDTDDTKNDEETNKRMSAWVHQSHLTNSKLHNDILKSTRVDIG